MIQANELRIGNWVYYGESMRRVTLIANSPQRNAIGVDNMICDITTPDPIPLTPEILEKAGFVKDKDDVYIMGKCLYYIGDVLQIAMGYAPLMNCPCKYVHQLQNLIFALTGTELEINLNP